MCIETIMSRRSVRRYKAGAVSDGAIGSILKAAMAAPSAGDQQPWHFIVIRDKAALSKIAKEHPHAIMVPEADVALLVCGDESLEKHKGYWVQDCSAATENALLAAHALGLGAVWVGVYPRQERMQVFKELLSIPEQVIPFSLVPIGYPAEQTESNDRYDAGRVHYGKW